MGKRIILGFHISPFVGQKFHRVRMSKPCFSHTEFFAKPESIGGQKIRPDLDRIEKRCLKCGEVLKVP